MSERDAILLDAIDSIMDYAVCIGLCPATFSTMKREVLRIMGERDMALARR